MQNYHRHTSYSNIWGFKDSAAVNEDYAKRAVELGHKVISSVEHGFQGYYFETYELSKKYDLKFIFGCEAYWVKDRHEKDRTNSHIILLAKNETDVEQSILFYRQRVKMDTISVLVLILNCC